ncbi:AMP-binding protein [bacterium]|nr:AMP-binding protein [bacterium]
MRDLYCYRDIAFSSLEEIRKIQEGQLQEHIAYCIKHSPFYSRLLKNVRAECSNITIGQLSKLPFTEKSDIEQNNKDFCAVTSDRIVDIVLSSGTTGRPIRMMYTDYDLKRLAYNEERAFTGCGLTSNDTVLLTCTMDRCFIAGLAYFLGIRNVGAAAIRNGHNSLESHLQIIKQMNPTVLIGVPSFLRKLGLYLKENGINPKKTAVSKLVCIGEPLRGENLELLKVGDELQSIWQAQAFSTYASSETVTTFCECTAQQGGHLLPDLAIIEIIDENGTVLSPGNIGEIVVTPMAVEGMPLIRFKTGDVSFLINEQCSCGRFSSRLGPILGRKKQMMKIKGTSLYPQAIYTALEEIDGIDDYYVTVSREIELSDIIEITISVNDASLTADMIQDKLRARLRVKPEVIIADSETIKQKVYTSKSRKPIRFIDKRQ